MDAQAHALAGAVLMTGIPGPRLDGATRAALETLRPSGIVLFRRNVESPDQLADLTAALHALPSHPLVAIDHEGGRVMRVGAPFTLFPPARAIARMGDPEIARAVGRAMGVELASVGIDVNFAPVLDVDSNPDNPVIGDRAFGATPVEVSAYALPFLQGLQEAGVLGCGKHFPGHGDTDRDSHVELPVVRKRRADLEATELVPFRAAIAAGVPLLMTAHVLYPALDERPATLSPRICRDLLRTELGFTGVLVSDDLAMQAVSGTAALPEVAVAALGAGVDWLLVCNDLALAQAAAARIADALDGGALDAAGIAASAARIRRLRPHRVAPPPVHLPITAHAALAERIRAAAA
jgi:beta-N-acetylhexosaminidase